VRKRVRGNVHSSNGLALWGPSDCDRCVEISGTRGAMAAFP
jgi:hypothetical protein